MGHPVGRVQFGVHWRKVCDAEGVERLRSRKPGRKPVPEASGEVERLQMENLRLQEHLRKAEFVIEVQKSGRIAGGWPSDPEQRAALTGWVQLLAKEVGLHAACAALGLPRSILYRQKKPRILLRKLAPTWILSASERQDALVHLHQPRFLALSVQEIYATLWDEGVWFCSLRTLQRLLAGEGELRERRAITRHPTHRKPKLLARGPNEVWSCDITKVRGPQK